MQETTIMYLKRLGLEVKDPTYAYLKELCHAHLCSLPFENISKFIYYQDYPNSGVYVPPYPVFTQNLHEWDSGGTCYTLNTNFCKLLQVLGFECYNILLSRAHMAIIVKIKELKGERVYVDVGNAAPFFEPVRIEHEKVSTSKFGSLKIHLKQTNEKNNYEYVRVEKEKVTKEWSFNSTEKFTLEDVSSIIDKANQPGTLFMSLLRCQLWQVEKKRNISLVNNRFSILYQDGNTEHRILSNMDELECILAQEFQLPKLPVHKAVEILTGLGVNIFDN